MLSIEHCISAIEEFASIGRKVTEQINNIKGTPIEELYEESQLCHMFYSTFGNSTCFII